MGSLRNWPPQRSPLKCLRRTAGSQSPSRRSTNGAASRGCGIRARGGRRLRVPWCALVAFASGITVALLSWILLVPWDLSEVDERGRQFASGGDGRAAQIGIALLIVAAAGVALAWTDQLNTVATVFTVSGSVTWMILFAWRVAVSRTSGANFFVIPLIMFVLPLTILTPLAVRGLARRRTRGPGAHRSNTAPATRLPKKRRTPAASAQPPDQ